ncbi:hypothetical protein BG011_009175 [Mortierella polycephala]|uniref:Secreted protein n=1 Tax=Mortierella polycephala TaxID=41804 RepID=A0A9P6QBS0_9FUNG|nr:hypothetical protein BG011_009175 [Mortierella polycephala]
MKTITLISLANALLFCTLYTLAAPLPAPAPYSPASDRRTAPTDVCQPNNRDASNNPVCNPNNYNYRPNSPQTGTNTSNGGTSEYPESTPTRVPQTTDKRRRDLVLPGQGPSELSESRDDEDTKGEARISAGSSTNSRRSFMPRGGGIGSMYPKDGTQGR